MAELLTTPGLPHPRDDTEPSLTAAFRAGFTDCLEGEERKIVQTCNLGEHEKGVVFLIRLINLDALEDYNHFKELYTLIFGKQTMNIPTLFREEGKKAAISNMAKSLEADDQAHQA